MEYGGSTVPKVEQSTKSSQKRVFLSPTRLIAKNRRKYAKIVMKHLILFLRRCVLSYSVFCCTIHLLVLLISFFLDFLYTYRQLDREPATSPGTVIILFEKISLFGIFILAFIITSRSLGKCLEYVFSVIWSKGHYAVLSRQIHSFWFCCAKSDFRASSVLEGTKAKEYDPNRLGVFDFCFQSVSFLLLEILPIILALVYFVVYVSPFQPGYFGMRPVSIFVFTIGISHCLYISLWWLMGIVENYVRFFYAVVQAIENIFGGECEDEDADTPKLFPGSVGASIQDTVEVKRVDHPEDPLRASLLPQGEDSLVDSSKGSHAMYGSVGEGETEADGSMSDEQTRENVEPCSEMEPCHSENNLWVIAVSVLCCSKIQGELTLKSIWMVVMALMILCMLSLMAIFVRSSFWMVFGFCIVTLSCFITQSMAELYTVLPPHHPTMKRLQVFTRRSKWKKQGLPWLYAIVLIVEEVFERSPFAVMKSLQLFFFVTAHVIIGFAVFRVKNSEFFIWTVTVPIALIVCLIWMIYAFRFGLLRKIFTIGSKKDCGVHGSSYSPLEEEKSKNDHLIKPLEDFSACGWKNAGRYLTITSVVSYVFLVFGVIFALVVIQVFLVIIGRMSIWSPIVTLLFAFLLNFRICERHQAMTGYIRQGLVMLFTAVVVIVMLTGLATPGYQVIPMHPAARRSLTVPEILHLQASTMKATTRRNRYGICDTRFASNFSIVDMGFFTWLAYEGEGSLPKYLSNCDDCYIRGYDNTSTMLYYYDIYSRSRDLSIIAVRGVSMGLRLLQDMDVWQEIALLQLASVVSPLLGTFGKEKSATLIAMVSKLQHMLLPMVGRYYDDLNAYVAKRKGEVGEIILTGHSLGGGVAKIVGALQGLKAVAFASPGLVYTSKKLGFSQDVLDRIAINVKPELDLISDIDILGGDVQRLKCLFVSSYYCHRLFGIIDQLINVCGDSQGRWLAPP